MPQYGFDIKKKNSLMEDKKVQRVHTHQNPKMHISPVSLLLWQKMMVMHCFVLGSTFATVVSEAMRRNLSFSN